MAARSPSKDKLRARGPLARSPDKDKLPGVERHGEPPLVVRTIVRGNRRPMRFVSLHHHSTFSYLDGYQMPDAHVRRATELHMGAMALTEHGNTDSHSKFERAAREAGVKSIFGCEVYMPAPWGKKGDEDWKTQKKCHLTLLAKNATGYRNLLQLVSWSWDAGFYYKPTVTMEALRRHKEGIIVLSGCAGSLLSCSIVGGKGLDPSQASYKAGLDIAREFKRTFGENYYIEVQGFPELEDRCQANPILAQIARRLNIRLAASMDCHYTAIEEREVQQILHNLRGQGNDEEDSDRGWKYETGLCPPLNDGAIVRKLQKTGLTQKQAIEAVQSTADIAEECDVTLPKLPMPQFPLPKGFKGDTQSYFRKKINDGWKYRKLDQLPPKERARYKARLRYEVELIRSKNYENYFLIIANAVSHIKDLGIPVGPARGSAAASLAAFVLRITEVDPLKFPLLVFERFIDPNREDLPDIDIDFPSEVRDDGIMRAHLQSLYPSVVNVGTFTEFKGRNSLDDVARVFRVPKFEVDTIKTYLIERSSGDLRASATVEDTIEQFPQAADVIERYPNLRKAELLEGNVKGAGIHAAAYVVANGDIRDVVAVYKKKLKDISIDVVALDKEDAEYRGLLKKDYLGLSTMSAIWDMLRWSNMTPEELYQIPVDDPKVYKGFMENDVTGVFQFDGRAMRSVCQIIKPQAFIELMDVNALSRPGPLHNGSASEYAAIKFGRAKPTRIHPAVDSITSKTKFCIVYQEQTMQIVRLVGNFPWTSVAYIRKIISRKLGEQEFNRQWDRFWEGAQTLHKRTDFPPITEQQAKKVWGDMVTSGSYQFNAAHCVAYCLLAYWTMWFKRIKNPTAFYAASAKHYSEDKQRDILRDADKHGVKVLKPRAGQSSISWKPVGRNRIRAGYQQIDGIGEKTAELITGSGYTTFDEFVALRGIGPKTVHKIKQWVRQDDPFDIYRLEKSIATIKEEIRLGKLIDGDRVLPMPYNTSREIDNMESGDRICWIGEMVKCNVRDLFEQNVAKSGVQLDPDKIRDPHLREFAIVYARDEDDQTMIKFSRWTWPRYKQQIFDLEEGDLLLIVGRKPRYGIAANKMWVVRP